MSDLRQWESGEVGQEGSYQIYPLQIGQGNLRGWLREFRRRMEKNAGGAARGMRMGITSSFNVRRYGGRRPKGGRTGEPG